MNEDSVEIAILKTKLDYLETEVVAMRKDVSDIKRALTTAGGIKMALVAVGAGLAFVVSQVWHFLNYAK